ncbi:MAG: hypothetical protein ACYCOY_00855 [Metallibacterium sp.]
MTQGNWTGNRDGHWYSGAFIEASAGINPSCSAVSIYDFKIRGKLTAATLQKFLWETSRNFQGLQIWLPLTGELRSMLGELSSVGSVRWEVIDNPLSKSARILFVGAPTNGA